MASLLIVDDEASIRASLAGALGREGYAVETAATLAEARARLREAFDLVLLDVRFPDGSGLDLLAEIGGAAPETVVVMMSGHATLQEAVRATRLGAYDVLEKPLSFERLLVVLRNAAEVVALREENRRLKPVAGIVGRSAAVEALRREIALAGPSSSRVLIRGEHGTGKELVARALHEASPRRGMPFVALNCSAIPDDLFESELFGHERGAFTGATQSRRGLVEEADRGTLFLDEVGDLSPRAQTKLLRVLQESEITRVGGTRVIRVNVRVIAATNRDLERAIAEERFREDLFFRLAVIPIVVPPLRERPDDIPVLVEHFVKQLAAHGVETRGFERAALDLLSRYAFPGNVRELLNLVERLLIMNPGARIGPEHVRAVIPPDATGRATPSRLADAVREFERRTIEAALAAEDGHMTRAAARLGLERSHLYKKMKQLGWQADP